MYIYVCTYYVIMYFFHCVQKPCKPPAPSFPLNLLIVLIL